MVRFCSKCGTYISPHQEACSRCAPVEAKTPLVTLPPSELTIETVLNSFPSDTLRPYQKETLNNIVEAFQSGKKCILVIAPTGFGKCLTQCERIFSEKGLIRIKDVQQSDDHNFRTPVFHLGRAKTVRIRTRHGYSLHGGHDHRIITFDGEFGWRKLSSLKTGDCVPIFAKKSLGVDVAVNDLPARYNKTGAPPAAILLPRSLTTQLAELLGLYLSEGSIGRSVVHISTDDESIKADIAKVARQCKISFTVADREIRLNSIHMARLLVDMVGVGSHNKKVPDQIFRAKQNIRAAFLRGCFRGDGDVNISRNVSEYFTVSRELAQGIQLLLLSVGVFSTLARKSGQYRDRAHKSWRITLTGSQNVRFLRLVFGKRIATDSSSSWETIPMIEHKLNTVFRTFLKVKGIRHRSKEYTALKTVESYVLGYRKPTRKTLKRYLQSMSEVSYLKQYAELMRLTEVDCLFDYVEGVVNSREEDLYDLSCADGTYVSNGFVSHNSYVNAAFSSVTKSFYVTPQLALIDQLLADPHLKTRFVEIKGRQNYRCYYSPHRGVHVGKCETEDYPCHERFDVCPYWMQKQLALQAPSVLMSLAYMTFEGTTEGSETYLGTRSLLVLDEAHNLEEQCLSHVALQFTPFSVPYEIYHKFLPDLRNVDGRVEMEAFLANVAEYLKLLLGRLETKAETHGLSIKETENKKAMERFLENHHLFTFSRSEWVWQIRNDQLLLQPVFAREFMKDLVWKRGEHYLISSATILDPQEYIKLNGLTDFLKEDEIAILQVPSIFPAENRPIIDATVGVLSKQQWEHNMPLAVATVEQILRKERGNVAIHCYDKKTRVLTKRGFRHFSELTYRDQIATLNPKTGYLEYHKPRRIINYEHDGPMYEFRSRNIDLMVTPEHRLWVAPVYARKDLRKYRFSTPAELFSTSQKGSSERHYFAVKRTALWKGKGSVKKIVLPGGKRIQIDDWLRFLGWYLAEGTHRKAGVDRDYGLITLSQSLHSPYLSEIESLVKRLGFKHGKYLTKKDNVICFNIYSDVLEAVLKPLGDHAQEKTMPQQVKELPPEKLRILFEALMKGDGHLRFSDGGYPQWQFTTTSDRLSDDMFEIGLKLGMAVSEYSFDRTSYRPSRIKGRVISPKHQVHVLTFSTVKQCATICTSDSKGRKYAKPKLVQYRGSVGCVDVKNHVIFVERNGNACWSGNCHSYRHQRALVANLSPDLKQRLIVHTGKDREEKLQEWMRSRGKVFVSVAFNEGQDWKYDICLVPDEEIMTSEGVKKISDVRTGDRVLTHKGRFRKVKDVKTRNYNGKVISIAPYYTAQPFRVTTQHPILTDKGWVNAEQIVDECIAYPRLPSSSKSAPRMDLTYEVRRRGFHKCENSSHTAHYFRENIQLHRELSPSEMRLCGYYLAEGSTGQHQVILYFGKTARELQYARDAARLFRELFNRKASIRHTEYGNAVVFGSINAAKWFSSMFGQRAIEKKIPTSWLYSDDEHIIELLKGYFRGDGNHYENVFRAITASITLAHEIRLLLARFGIVATVSMRKGGKRTIQGRMANTNTRYPISIGRTQAVQAFQLLGEKLTVRRKRSFKVKATICNDYIYSQIHNKSTSHYSGKVYNLEVEEDNSYVGVSCIYHNCDAQILLKVPFADIGDMRVKRRLELGQRQWYENQAMLEAIQAYGRAIRAEDDIARFYVVDGSFISLVRNTWQFIPDWFKAALPPTFTI